MPCLHQHHCHTAADLTVQQCSVTSGVVTLRETTQAPSFLGMTEYSSIHAASVGPSTFFLTGKVYSTNLFFSVPKIVKWIVVGKLVLTQLKQQSLTLVLPAAKEDHGCCCGSLRDAVSRACVMK